MKKVCRKIALLGLLALAFTGCKKDKENEEQENTKYGSYVNIGGGKARSFVIYNPDGSAKQVGLRFSEGATTALPDKNTAYVLPMPPGNKTTINHISMDYAVHGHPPDSIYTVAHFDVHFYMISEVEKNAISVDDPRINILPPADLIPKNYIGGANEPKMGKHWADTTSHEFHGHDFTSTFIYGSYDGKFIFLEPMIALSYLKTKPNVTLPITPLGRRSPGSLNPGKYTIQWETIDKEYVVALTEF
jgi:hypothetical protein